MMFCASKNLCRVYLLQPEKRRIEICISSWSDAAESAALSDTLPGKHTYRGWEGHCHVKNSLRVIFLKLFRESYITIFTSLLEIPRAPTLLLKNKTKHNATSHCEPYLIKHVYTTHTHKCTHARAHTHIHTHYIPSSTTTSGPITTLGPMRQPSPILADGSCRQSCHEVKVKKASDHGSLLRKGTFMETHN